MHRGKTKRAFLPAKDEESSWYHPCSQAATCTHTAARSPQSRDNGRIPCATRIPLESFTALARRSLRAGRRQGKLSASGFPSLVARSRLLFLVIASCKDAIQYMPYPAGWQSSSQPPRAVNGVSPPARPSPLPPRSPGDWRAPRECVRAASREAAPTDSPRLRDGR